MIKLKKYLRGKIPARKQVLVSYRRKRDRLTDRQISRMFGKERAHRVPKFLRRRLNK